MISLKDAIYELNHNIEFKNARMVTEGEVAIYLEELQRYADLEEQGRLIELPCAVGDVLYGSNEEFVVKEISYWEDDCDLYSLNIRIEDWKENFEIISPEDIGKTVFFTKAEAEAALKESEKE